jgi:hypothetical protein
MGSSISVVIDLFRTPAGMNLAIILQKRVEVRVLREEKAA